MNRAELALDTMIDRGWIEGDMSIVRDVEGGITVWTETEVHYISSGGAVTRHALTPGGKESVILD